jgi:hypothetical protein
MTPMSAPGGLVGPSGSKGPGDSLEHQAPSLRDFDIAWVTFTGGVSADRLRAHGGERVR